MTSWATICLLFWTGIRHFFTETRRVCQVVRYPARVFRSVWRVVQRRVSKFVHRAGEPGVSQRSWPSKHLVCSIDFIDEAVQTYRANGE